MRRPPRVIAGVFWLLNARFAVPAFPQTHPIQFEEHILPIFQANCVKCHAGSSPQAGLDVRTLAGFRRVSLKPGEARTVDFQLTSKELGLYNKDMKFVVEPGKFRVYVGGSSVGGLEAEFEVSARVR